MPEPRPEAIRTVSRRFVALLASLGVLAILGLSLVLAPIESANAASFTWAGGSTGRTESAAHWSTGANWVGSTAPTTSQAIETLTFPRLTNSECTSEPPINTCYLTLNDIAGLSVESIHLDDADDYLLAGEPITLGSGGLTATPEASHEAGAFLEMPLTLSASQNWSITSGGGTLEENGLAIGEPITGTGKSLTIELSKEAALLLASNVEVGSLAIDGANAGQAGIFNGVVDLLGGDLNASNDQPVELNHIFAIGSGSLGALSMHAGVLVAAGAKGIEAASVRLDSSSRLGFEISGSGTAGNSELKAHGPIELQGGEFEVTVRPAKKGQPCPVLSPGQQYTFVSTTGTLSGSFANAPEGGPEIPIELAEACKKVSQTMQITYSRSGGTETVTGTVEEARVKREAKEQQEAKERQEAREKQEQEAETIRKGSAELKVIAERQAREREEQAAAEKRSREEAERLPASATVTGTTQTPLSESGMSLDGSTITVQGLGAAGVKLTCTGTGMCGGKLTLTAKGTAKKGKKAKTEVIGTASFSIPAGKTVTIKLTLNTAGKALLGADHGRLGATLSIVKSSPAPWQTHTDSVHLVQQKAHGKAKK